MSAGAARPVLLCFDGSADAAAAIEGAAELLGDAPGVVLSVCEPVRNWEPSDPATILDVPISRLLSKALELEEIASEVARAQAETGAELARSAGFEVAARVGHGKAWKVICEVAEEIDAAVIVVGPRGLSRVRSALLGSVTAAVSTHAHQPVLIVHRRQRSSAH